MRSPTRSTVLCALVALVAASASASACGDGCPDPLFGEPTVPDGIQDAPGGGQRVVVRWEASPGDALPEAYYQGMTATELVSPVTRAEATASRELTIELSGSSDVRTTSRDVTVQFSMDDTQAWLDCSHPGMADVYFVELALSFDGRGGVSAAFSEVSASRGACAVGAPGRRGPSAAGALLPLAAALLLRLRRRRHARR